MKTYLQRLPKKQPVPLEKLYPEDKCHPEALNLLGKMLKLDPNERISVGDALAHKYLKEYHCIDDEPVCFPPFEFDFEDIPFTKDDLKARILKEIEQFHKEKSLILSPVSSLPKELQSSQVSSTQLRNENGHGARKKGNLLLLRYKYLFSWMLFNPLYPNISTHILHTVLFTFPKVLTRRICLTIKSLCSWGSFPLFLSPQYMIQG